MDMNLPALSNFSIRSIIPLVDVKSVALSKLYSYKFRAFLGFASNCRTHPPNTYHNDILINNIPPYTLFDYYLRMSEWLIVSPEAK